MKRYPVPEAMPQMPRHEPQSPWTPELGRLAQNGYRHLAEVLRDTGAQEHFRAMWATIDRSLQYSVLSGERVFAGISGDGKRYIEVYPHASNPGISGVFIGRTEYIDSQLELVGAAQRGNQRAGGDFIMAFADPQHTAAGTPAAMHIRPTAMGTSSYFYEEGNNDSYGGEYFPTAYMQGLSGFDTDNLRTSAMDDGRPLPYGLIVRQPFNPAEGGMPQTVPTTTGDTAA